MKTYSEIPIKMWAVEDRPREKMAKRGTDALTDAELLAILLGTGIALSGQKLSALDLARQLLSRHDGLAKLARCSVEELTQTQGIGPAKAISIIAAFELGRRKEMDVVMRKKLFSSKDAARYLCHKIGDQRQEVFYAIFLDVKHQIVGEKALFRGGVSATIVDIKLLIKEAIDRLASAIILAHNHPSGDVTPSKSDIKLTTNLREATKIFDITLVDHLIVTADQHYSFANQAGW